MDKPRSANICNVYVLPLLALNKHAFGPEGNFVNSYVSEDDNHVVVECLRPFTTVITNHPNYCFSMMRDNNYLAVFQVPDFYKEDVKLFRKGQYSKFSEQAKERIRKKSGLTYRAAGNSGQYRTALELLALDKDPVAKEYWERKLSNKGSKVTLPDDAELASIPDENCFYTLNLTSQLTSL
jgi:hypothetical protein